MKIRTDAPGTIRRFLLALLFAVLPFELLIAEGVHGIFKSVLPVPSLVLYPIPAIFALFFVFEQLGRKHVLELDRVTLVALSLMAIPSVIHVLFGNWLDLNFLVLGIGAFLTGMILSRSSEKDFVLNFLIFGLIFWCCAVIVIWLIDAHRFLEIYEWAHAYRPDQLLLALRNPESIHMRFYWPDLAGNWNKVANLIVMMFLIIISAIYRNRNRNLGFLLAMLMLSLVLVVSFSRGGILISAISGSCLLALKGRVPDCNKSAWTFAAFIMIGPLVITLLAPATRAAWIDMSSVIQRVILIEKETGFISGNTHSEIQETQSTPDADNSDMQAAHSAPGITDPVGKEAQLIPRLDGLKKTLFGIGVGNYGLDHFGYSFAGTHNMFLDMFIAGGAIGLFGIVLLFSYASFKALWTRSESLAPLIGGLGVLVVAVLSFREFDLNYLGVCALPALLTGWLIGEALGGSENRVMPGERRA